MATPEEERKHPPIPKEGEYWKNYSELAIRKRVMPRLDGTPAYNVLNATREIESRLLIFPGFVGVGPRGSRWQGYALSISDYDFVILVDSSASGCNLSIMRAAANDIRDVWGADQKIRIHYDFENIAGIVQDTDLTRFGVGHLQALAALGGDVIGPNIRKYREIAHDKLTKMSPEKREKLLANVAALRLDQEETRSALIDQRINGGVTRGYRPDYTRSHRTALWERKIFKTFGIRDTPEHEKGKP